MDFFLTLQNVSILFLLIVIGYIIGKLNIVTKTGQKELTALVLKVTMPATIIIAMQVPFSAEKMQNIIKMVGIVLMCYSILFISSLIFSNIFPKLDNKHKDILKVGIMLSNTSFMGYPVVLSLLGEEALFYAVICGGFIFEIVSWTYGAYLIGRNVGANKASLKSAIINPGVISIFVGGILFFTKLQIPEPLFSTMNMLSKATSPLAMLVVGLILSRTKIKEAFSDISIFVIALVKLIVNPLIILLVLNLFKFEGMNKVIPVVLLSMPTAAYVAMFSANSGNDEKYAGQLVFLTSLLSLASIPIITSLL